MSDLGFNQQLAALVGGLIAGSVVTWAACMVWFRQRRWYVLTFATEHEGAMHVGAFLATNEERLRRGKAAIRRQFGVDPDVITYDGDGVIIPVGHEE